MPTAPLACSWCGSTQAVNPDVRDGRRTGRWICNLRGTADHPRTACFLPWFLGVPPEEFRAQNPDLPSARPEPVEHIDEVSACLHAVALVLRKQGWGMGASDLLVLARQLHGVPEVQAAVGDALAAHARRAVAALDAA